MPFQIESFVSKAIAGWIHLDVFTVMKFCCQCLINYSESIAYVRLLFRAHYEAIVMLINISKRVLWSAKGWALNSFVQHWPAQYIVCLRSKESWKDLLSVFFNTYTKLTKEKQTRVLETLFTQRKEDGRELSLKFSRKEITRSGKD